MTEAIVPPESPTSEAIKIIDVTQPIATHDHKCWHCGQAIFKGIRHNKVVYTDDMDKSSRFHSIRYHIFCLKPQGVVGG